MFEDKFESVIKEEVNQAVAGIISKEEIKAAFKEAISDIFEPVAREQKIIEAWPSNLETVYKGTPAITSQLAKVCLSVWKTTF